MIPVLTTVQQVFTKSATREEGCLQLINIGMKLQGTQKTIVKFIKNMLEYFPLNDLGEIIKEDDLKSRYILPMLQSLFDDLDDENNAGCKQKVFDVSHRRPDGQFRQKAECDNLIIIGYMETKTESESKSYEACM
jgi:sulfur transfer protein SufE